MTDTVSVRKHTAASWKLPFSAAELSVLLKAMLDGAGCGETAIELALLDDAAMERLNEESTGCAGPTNILAFPAQNRSGFPDSALSAETFRSRPPDARAGDGDDTGNAEAPPCLGWLALSTDALLRECFLYGQTTEEHCIRLLAHGVVHLAGLDHGPDMDRLAEKLEAAAWAVFS